MTTITRIEIALNEDGSIRGAQASLSNGRVIGVNTGANPEYDTGLAEVLGEALTNALSHVAQAAEQNTALQAELDAAVAAGRSLQVTIEQQQATIEDLHARLNAPTAAGTVSARQFKMQLEIDGLTETVAKWVSGQKDKLVQIAFDNSSTFVRSEPMMQAGFTALGLTDEQINAFFAAAAKL